MLFKVRAPDGGTWVVVLLVLLTLVPSACVLWFMSEALATASDAGRQRVLEAYRGQLRLVRSRLDGVWRAQAARLDAVGAPEPGFARLMTDQIAEGAVFLAPDGTAAYPRREIPRAGDADDLERRAAAIPVLPPEARPAAVTAVADRLNDYATPLPATLRVALMDQLRTSAPNVWLSTQAALHLSLDLLDAERPAPVPDIVRQTALHDVWALTSRDRRVVGLYRTGRLEAMLHDFLHEISPAGVVFIAYPPDVPADAEAIAAGPWLPGWQLSFVPLRPTPADEVASRRRTVYLSVGIIGIGLIAVGAGVASGGLRRHLQLARLKTDLVAAASHELRTPLASMRVLVDGLLADTALDPMKTRDYLELLSTENARLSRLVDNFLTFSKLDRRGHRFALAPLAPAAVVTSAVDAIRDRLPPSCELQIDLEQNLPMVQADADALPAALVNLLDNALKYTPAEKHITVRIGRGRNGFVSFAVIDNGIGLGAGERRRVFRPFYRVDRRLARDTGGVGLGLSIVEAIVRGHRGRVRVDSQAGGGSTFTIDVPVVRTDAAA